MSSLLCRLATNEFLDGIGFVLPPVPLRSVLQQSDDVRAVAIGLRCQQVTGSEVRQFVGKLLKSFATDELFRYDLTLAALAVALGHWDDPFADEYLLDLARIQRCEIRAAPLVARECLKARNTFPGTQIRTFRYSTSPGPSIAPKQILRVIQPCEELEQMAIRWTRYSKVEYANR